MKKSVARMVEAFEKAGWKVLATQPVAGRSRRLGKAPDGLATLEIVGGETLRQATLVAVTAADAPQAAHMAGRRLAALMALAAPELLNAGWLSRALRAPMPRGGVSRQVISAAGVTARLTRNRRKSTVTLMVRVDDGMRLHEAEAGA